MAELRESCKLCGGEVTYKFSLPLVAGLEGRYFECNSCQLLHSHHLDSTTPSELEKTICSSSVTELDSGATWRLSCVAGRLESLVRLGLLPRRDHNFRALDFGCGSGFLVSYLAHRFGWNASGYEPFTTPAFGQDKIFTDWESVRQRGPFGLIVASEVFEHFIQPREELLRLGDVLAREGAFLYVTTGLYLPGKTDAKWPYLAPQSGHHVSFYARRTMEKVAQLLGASGVYQAGANYEWLLAFGGNGAGQKTKLAFASSLLGLGTRLGIFPVIE